MSARVVNHHRIGRTAVFANITFIVASALVAAAQTAITTYHYDNYRTGWNQNETVLTQANVGNATFGLLQKVTLDDQVDAQPLVVPAVTITAGNYQGTHDVVYVATENNSVYAIDVHSGTVLLSSNFGTPVPRPLGCTNNGPNVGINSTPVIDLSTHTLYVMVYTKDTTGPTYRLHALNLGSLTDNVTPQVVTASHTLSDGSTFNFNATYQRQRPGLLLANGSIYAGFGSFCDYAKLSRGWLLGWTAGSLTPFTSNQINDQLATSPNTFFLSSIWMSGYGPPADDSGNVLFVTGNSDQSGTTYDGITNIQESVVKVPSTLGTVTDLFTPMNQSTLDKDDEDFGSGGVLVLPDQPGSTPHLAVAAGKYGTMYLMNEDDLGGYSTTQNNVLGTYLIGQCWCGPSYFVDPSDGAGRIVSSGGKSIRVWKVVTSPQVSLTNVASASITSGQDPGFFTSVSSNGTSNPIIWAISRPTTSDNGAPISLYAFNPESGGSTMTTLLETTAGNWPNRGGNSNLVPVVANGLVFVASNQQLQIFGPTGGTAAATNTTLSSSVDPSVQGKATTLTATVSLQSGTGTPPGSVTFRNGSAILATKTLSSGTATFASTTLPPGPNLITAIYGGSPGLMTSTSTPLNQFVQAATTTVVTSSLPTQSVYGQAVLFSATLRSTIGAPPDGEIVTFEQGTNVLGTGTLSGGVATFADSTLPVGKQSIKAVYPGDVNFTASTSGAFIQTVVKAITTTSLTSSQNSSDQGQSVTFTATVAPQFIATPSGAVAFYNGTTKLSTVMLSGGVATYTTKTLATGTAMISAQYLGSGSFLPSTSTPLSQVVN
jgi:Bacterial Ig-like domain (group 3)